MESIALLMPQIREVVAFLDQVEGHMAAFAEQMRALAHWEAELNRREAELDAREAELRPRLAAVKAVAQ